jgi:hypothetical protein
LAAFGLVVDAHDLVDGESGVDGVLADEVPVAHPGGAVVAYGAVVGEGSGGGELFGATVGEGVGLRDGEERSAGADGFEDGGVDVAELRGGLNAAYVACGLGFEAGGVSSVLRC